MYEIEHYITATGEDVFEEYLASMRDMQAYVKITRRLDRVRNGNFGDHKRLNNDVWELRIDTGQGYRVYYTLIKNKIVLLLCAGNKSSQSKDIQKVIQYKQDYDKNN